MNVWDVLEWVSWALVALGVIGIGGVFITDKLVWRQRVRRFNREYGPGRGDAAIAAESERSDTHEPSTPTR